MPIRTTETTSSLSETYNWKSVGDQIPDYWQKVFTASHNYMMRI